MILTFIPEAEGIMITLAGLHPSALVFFEVNMSLYNFSCLLSNGSTEHYSLRM